MPWPAAMFRIQRSDFMLMRAGSLSSADGTKGPAEAVAPGGRRGVQVFFWITIFGNAALWSCCRSAIFRATLRAMSR